MLSQKAPKYVLIPLQVNIRKEAFLIFIKKNYPTLKQYDSWELDSYSK